MAIIQLSSWKEQNLCCVKYDDTHTHKTKRHIQTIMTVLFGNSGASNELLSYVI